jgi:hypothetical protein
VDEAVREDWNAETLHYIYKDLRVVSQYTEEGRGHLDLEKLLQVANSTKARDDRDEVYGLLGLIDPAIADSIKPDYNLPVRDIYSAIATRHISTTGNLNIIREGNPWGATQTPSWAPD